jgi:glycosyltransferase involved in cell wall biosynthesis
MSEQKELPFLSLSVIVKNEEKVIKRMLDSVAPILDYYVIIDTGSTDRTKEIAKETMDAHGIPGEIIDHEWVNFCTARNFAFEMTQGKAQYGFWIDADEQLIIEPSFSKVMMKHELSKHDMGSMMVEYGNQNYFRAQFHKLDYPFEWRGAVHEVQFPIKDKAPHPVTSTQIQGLRTLVTPDGSSWGDRSKEAQIKKYLEHAELLHEYIKEDDDVRWIFYLAQSYRDAFEWAKSEEWYAKRVELGGGYWEELYYSQLMVASMKANQAKPVEEVLEAYAQCSKFDPNRAEHLIPLIRHHQAQKNWPIAYALSRHAFEFARNNPFPKSSLFIDKMPYDWGVADLHSVSCYYMRKPAEAKKAYSIVKRAISNGLVPENQVNRLLENEKWFSQMETPKPNRNTNQQRPKKKRKKRR